ncbi:hypothetical protein E2C01_036467 [Portunus trituberculatus]|uniref:Uncharacterized protein n=1 Tax=Portunus trituberculatus TaxID=210409 RepID=A0A5B7FC04_PORTR|nr:hypothetical protein [Portunus trituberculatus]
MTWWTLVTPKACTRRESLLGLPRGRDATPIPPPRPHPP